MNELKIRSNDINAVIVVEQDGYAVAKFYHQRGKTENLYDALGNATRFINMMNECEQGKNDIEKT